MHLLGEWLGAQLGAWVPVRVDGPALGAHASVPCDTWNVSPLQWKMHDSPLPHNSTSICAPVLFGTKV